MIRQTGNLAYFCHRHDLDSFGFVPITRPAVGPRRMHCNDARMSSAAAIRSRSVAFAVPLREAVSARRKTD